MLQLVYHLDRKLFISQIYPSCKFIYLNLIIADFLYLNAGLEDSTLKTIESIFCAQHDYKLVLMVLLMMQPYDLIIVTKLGWPMKNCNNLLATILKPQRIFCNIYINLTDIYSKPTFK